MSENCTHDCSSCGENCPSRSQNPADFIEKLNPKSRVNKTIGIVSGKGGVGKSLVTSLLAVTARRAGLDTAVLDADVTGPIDTQGIRLERNGRKHGGSRAAHENRNGHRRYEHKSAAGRRYGAGGLARACYCGRC